MQIALTVNDQATPTLQAAARQLRRPRPLMAAAAKAVVVRLRQHFKERQGEGNKQNWPPQHFWYGVRNSVANNTGISQVTDTSATVTVADYRFVHKITGGTIKPKRHRNLIIPLRAEAYKLTGKGTVRESAPFLKLIKLPSGAYLGESAEKLWFRLVKSVTQPADPRAMPPMPALYTAVEAAAQRVLPILLRRETGARTT